MFMIRTMEHTCSMVLTWFLHTFFHGSVLDALSNPGSAVVVSCLDHSYSVRPRFVAWSLSDRIVKFSHLLCSIKAWLCLAWWNSERGLWERVYFPNARIMNLEFRTGNLGWNKGSNYCAVQLSNSDFRVCWSLNSKKFDEVLVILNLPPFWFSFDTRVLFLLEFSW